VRVPQVKYAFPSNFEADSLGRERGGDRMKMRKDVIFAILTTFCLCALMFSVIPIKSAGLPYDPWTDINEDGTINMKDIGNVAAQFGTTGDPTKNVTVTNWPRNKLAYNASLSLENSIDFYSDWIPVNEYSKVSVCISSGAHTNHYDFMARHAGGKNTFYVDSLSDMGLEFNRVYDVPNEEIRVYFMNYDLETVSFDLDIYLLA
jgi:hypothetical protein